MSKVVQLPPRRQPAIEFSRLNHLVLRADSGGDGSSDAIWNGRINDALKQLSEISLGTYTISLRVEPDEHMVEQLTQLLERHRLDCLKEAGVVTAAAMSSLALELTGGTLPVGWPFHHKR